MFPKFERYYKTGNGKGKVDLDLHSFAKLGTVGRCANFFHTMSMAIF